jgi:8-oxo-dGTP pyrophosphatase MutT (NUDIX family)
MTTPADDYTATLPRKRMGAAVLFTDPEGRILIVEPTYKDYWEIPGGVVEAGAAAAVTARAEAVTTYLQNGYRVEVSRGGGRSSA